MTGHDHGRRGAGGDGDPGDPCTREVLVGADGARLAGCAYGGHLLSWSPAGAARDRFWVSPMAGCGGGVAIRGGVPVVFPQFSDRALDPQRPLPKHGLARDRPWRLHRAGERGDGAAVLAFVLESDASTRAVWPYDFRLALTAAARADTLSIVLTVTNTDRRPWPFAAALHAYFAVGDADGAAVRGLAGHRGEDNRAGGAPLIVRDEVWAATGHRDVVVRDVAGPVLLEDPVLGPLELRAEGFPDRVVWNPGSPHGLSDVPAGGERAFVCVEPALLTPILLEPGEQWTGGVGLATR